MKVRPVYVYGILPTPGSILSGLSGLSCFDLRQILDRGGVVLVGESIRPAHTGAHLAAIRGFHLLGRVIPLNRRVEVMVISLRGKVALRSVTAHAELHGRQVVELDGHEPPKSGRDGAETSFRMAFAGGQHPVFESVLAPVLIGVDQPGIRQR